ncbi:hypothetical protein KUCAC02_026664, partial [Chaenocephalus aceratus]
CSFPRTRPAPSGFHTPRLGQQNDFTEIATGRTKLTVTRPSDPPPLTRPTDTSDYTADVRVYVSSASGRA